MSVADLAVAMRSARNAEVLAEEVARLRQENAALRAALAKEAIAGKVGCRPWCSGPYPTGGCQCGAIDERERNGGAA